jgi:hypothetical protein
MANGKPTPPEVVAMIRGMRAEGMIYSEIAKATHMPRSTVRSILLVVARKSPSIRPRKPHGVRMAALEPPDRRRKAIWCDLCESMVYPPCLACQVRGLVKRHGRQ